jgi:hypothetical protein
MRAENREKREESREIAFLLRLGLAESKEQRAEKKE